jgi:hypothetical protein
VQQAGRAGETPGLGDLYKRTDGFLIEHAFSLNPLSVTNAARMPSPAAYQPQKYDLPPANAELLAWDRLSTAARALP